MSSDPVIAFLLDEVVVKDWCKRAFQNIITELQVICILYKLLSLLDIIFCLFIRCVYEHFVFPNIVSLDNLEAEQMKTMLGLLLKFSAQLAGISNVLEVLDSSFKGSLSSQLHDFHQLLETILKTKQVIAITIYLFWGDLPDFTICILP